MAIGTILERQLEGAFPQYQRIWVQYSNKGVYQLCLTVFPSDGGPYRFIFGSTSTVNFESVSGIIQKYLDSR